MGVRAHHRVGIGLEHALVLLGEDHPGKEFHVHLMHDARVWRHDLEIVERLLSPFEELVTFPVALEFDLGVEFRRVDDAELVHLYGMVDDQFSGLQGVDLLGVAPQFGDGVAHGRQIHHRGDAGEVLHQHPGGAVLDLLTGLGLAVPVGQGLDVAFGDGQAVFVAQQVFQ